MVDRQATLKELIIEEQLIIQSWVKLYLYYYRTCMSYVVVCITIQLVIPCRYLWQQKHIYTYVLVAKGHQARQLLAYEVADICLLKKKLFGMVFTCNQYNLLVARLAQRQEAQPLALFCGIVSVLLACVSSAIQLLSIIMYMCHALYIGTIVQQRHNTMFIKVRQ